MSRRILSSLICTLTFAIAVPVFAQTATVEKQPPQEKQEAPRGRDMGAILIRGLKKTEGCIDVKTCEWSDGKRSIVAWFKNKEAATKWYYSSTHQAMIGGKTDGFEKKDKPLKHVKNADQPIMVIASLTPSSRPELKGINIPIKQISIEMFAALPGGAQMGGRVSPEGFKVPHMKNYSTDDSKSEKAEKVGKQ